MGIIKPEDEKYGSGSPACSVPVEPRPQYLQSLRQTCEDDRRKPHLTSPVYKRRPIRPANPNIFGTSHEPYWPVATDELGGAMGRRGKGRKPGKPGVGMGPSGVGQFSHLNSALPVSPAEKAERKERRRLLAARPLPVSSLLKVRTVSSTPGIRKMLERAESLDSNASY